MAKDPVCGMEVDEKTAKYKSIEAGNVYYFCSSSCQTAFSKDPEKYMRKEMNEHHASHYGGYCDVKGCGTPARSVAWYFYIGLLLFLILLVLLLKR